MAIVPHGYFYGFTLEQMLAERDRYVATVQKQGAGHAGALTSASENGSSFSFGKGDLSLKQWQDEIMNALNMLDASTFPYRSQARTRFVC